MRVFIIIFGLFFISQITAPAQGFDWQYSARLPGEKPDLFIGFSGEIGLSNSSGDINYFRTKFKCCSFSDGSGYSYKIGAAAEYWKFGNAAFHTKLSYSNLKSDFESLDEAYLQADSTYQQSRYRFSSGISYLTLETGVKWRIVGSHFHVLAGLDFDFLISQNANHYETYIQPVESEEILRESGDMPDLNSIVINPIIIVGYDYSFSKGSYSTLFFSFCPPAMSLTGTQDWKKIDFRLGVNYFFRGFETNLF